MKQPWEAEFDYALRVLKLWYENANSNHMTFPGVVYAMDAMGCVNGGLAKLCIERAIENAETLAQATKMLGRYNKLLNFYEGTMLKNPWRAN
jgi:hypothetical protein